MALSPNYSWSEPDNSSLVKNGAADIRTLGDAIDTSVWNVGFGQAGKNKIINGDFRIWQRGTSFTTSGATGQYTSDRWFVAGDAANSTISQQTFTAGSAPVAGYEGQYYLRYVKGGTTANQMFLSQRVEDVRTFAGQTVTLSYWAKASTGLTNEPLIQQNFGSGGSSEVYTTTTTQSLTTSWARYSVTIAVPSVSGKTIGTSSYVAFWPIRYTGTSNVTIEIWGVQVEAGSKATPFQTATGTIQGELAACQRYYRLVNYGVIGACVSTTTAQLTIYHPSMRTSPTLAAPSAVQISDMVSSNYTQSSASVSTIAATTDGTWLSLPNFTGLTSGRPATLNSSTGITLSAEL